ncbi:hypothetical protein WOLCODRAFT_139026 [Wolfiporia cocos MD-104 SS10]|uniref:Uncharacterized protein n=1 Tax=Wolfiporia cocos (strain MD-104) TaxID=742152 RepID=A0A2H3JZZ5_WOLCO|nr:hypothetical protein WOLCODRAFT_139026 [Wolfiporia cocos MD-104 SS10]
MFFPFSFSFNVPGLTNPFALRRKTILAPPQNRIAPFDAGARGDRKNLRRSPSPSLLSPVSRKRGWAPSDSEPSQPAEIRTSTSGYLDSPAKHRDGSMAASSQEDFEDMAADLPPPKRRRTLAGSIVSTALSAALIGTAVGLTVYRLWRDRGKQEALPPPPYEQGEWVPPKPDPEAELITEPVSVPTMHVTPPTPRTRKSRHVAGRRSYGRHRKSMSRSSLAAAAAPSVSSSSVSRLPATTEFNFGVPPPAPAQEDGDGDADMVIDDQMSWMSDRLASLIAEGQRALGKEVVVMSESQEDEVDDGSENWVDQDQGQGSSAASTLQLRPHRPSSLSLSHSRHASSSSIGTHSVSPRRTRFDASPPPRRRRREASEESEAFANTSISVGTSFHEDVSAWQSDEMREAMQRARERMLRERERGWR